MPLIAAEERFGPSLDHMLTAPHLHGLDQSKAEAIAKNPHLLPFFFHPPEGQKFVVPAKAHQPTVTPVVRRNRWVVLCPFPGCSSAQHASRKDHWFFCAHCLNAAVGSRSIPVIWPKEASEIEALLERRPFVVNRNWEPHETIADLAHENASHGV